jgi:Putative phage tail protein
MKNELKAVDLPRMLQVIVFEKVDQVRGRPVYVLVTGRTTVKDAKTMLGMPECHIYGDGRLLPDDATFDDIKVVSAHVNVATTTIAAYFIMEFSMSYIAATVLAYAVVYVGTQLISNALFGQSGGTVDQAMEDPGDAASISSARNQIRLNQPWLFPMGTVRVAGDLNSIPYKLMVDDPENVREQTVGQQVNEQAQGVYCDDYGCALTGAPAFTEYAVDSGQWTIVAGTVWQQMKLYSTAGKADGQDPNAATTGTMKFDSATSLYQAPNSTAWVSFAEAHPMVAYSKELKGQFPEQAEQLCQTFNWGIGELEVTDLRIDQTAIDDGYTGVTISWGQQQSDRALLGLDTPMPNSPDGTAWPADAVVVQGAELTQNANVVDSGWVERQYENSAGDIKHCIINLRMGLYYSGQTVEARSVTVEYKHRFGTGAWSAPVQKIFTNADTRAVLNSIGFPITGTGVFTVAVRKVTTDSDDARHTNSVTWGDVVFLRNENEDMSNQWARNAGKNLMGLTIRASKQGLQGSLQELSGLVRSKCWQWRGAGDPVLPVSTATGWVWDYGSNPADWWLMFARGVYLRRTAEPGAPYSGKGWTVGIDNATGQRMIGAGIRDAKIDFVRYANWRRFCTARQLEFNALLKNQSTVHRVLTDIAKIGRGSFSWVGGKLAPIYEDPNDIPVMTFGASNTVQNSCSIQYAVGDVAEDFVVTYTNPDDGWSTAEVTSGVYGSTLQGSEARVDMTFGVTSTERAQREANVLAIRSNLQRRTITWKTGSAGLLLNRFDVVNLSNDMLMNAISVRAANDGTTVEISRSIEDYPGPFDVQVMAPDGALTTTTATKIDDRTIALASAIDSTQYDGAFPEDYHLSLIPQGGRLLRLRITSIEPGDGQEVAISATDDDPRIYGSAEFEGVALEPLDSPERLVVEAMDAHVEVDPCTGASTLHWTLQNTTEALLAINKNGVNTVITVPAQSLELGVIPAGTKYTVTIEPRPFRPDALVIPTTISF